MGNISLDCFIELFQVCLSVANQLGHDFQSVEEWSNEHEEEVCQNCGCSLFEYTVADKLSSPTKYLPVEHNVIELATENLAGLIQMFQVDDGEKKDLTPEEGKETNFGLTHDISWA